MHQLTVKNMPETPRTGSFSVWFADLDQSSFAIHEKHWQAHPNNLANTFLKSELPFKDLTFNKNTVSLDRPANPSLWLHSTAWY